MKTGQWVIVQPSIAIQLADKSKQSPSWTTGVDEMSDKEFDQLSEDGEQWNASREEYYLDYDQMKIEWPDERDYWKHGTGYWINLAEQTLEERDEAVAYAKECHKYATKTQRLAEELWCIMRNSGQFNDVLDNGGLEYPSHEDIPQLPEERTK